MSTSHKERVECEGCEGGIVEFMLPARSSTQESPDYGQAECEECHGTGYADCEICGEVALIRWSDDHGLYCSEECRLIGVPVEKGMAYVEERRAAQADARAKEEDR